MSWTALFVHDARVYLDGLEESDRIAAETMLDLLVVAACSTIGPLLAMDRLSHELNQRTRNVFDWARRR